MNCTGKRCPMQYGKVDPATCESVKYCQYATPPKTNADRIREMSDEELAEKITDEMHGNIWCEIVCSEMDYVCDGACEQHVLKWLKEEADT